MAVHAHLQRGATLGGPYPNILSWLNVQHLSRMDATCKQLYDLHKRGPWRTAGEIAYRGLELSGWSFQLGSQQFNRDGNMQCNWKTRCRTFHIRLRSFALRGGGRTINNVRALNETVCGRCILCTDQLASHGGSFYFEVKVSDNPDNLGLALLDLGSTDASTSVTFSPEVGSVLVERRFSERPNKYKAQGCLTSWGTSLGWPSVLGPGCARPQDPPL